MRQARGPAHDAILDAYETEAPGQRKARLFRAHGELISKDRMVPEAQAPAGVRVRVPLPCNTHEQGLAMARAAREL